MGWKHPFKSIGHIAQSGWRKTASLAKSSWKTTKSVVSTVHKDARDLVGGVGKLIDKSEARLADVSKTSITTLGSTVSSVGGSLSLPLIILGGVGVAFYLSQRR